MSENGGRSLACKYEAVFCIFLAAMVHLGRDNSELVYPAILFLFLALLTLNFLAILALRLWSSREWVSASIILANCGVITAILSHSGGPRSNLWVLFLLPIYTSAILLNGREVAWIATGVLAFNSVFYLASSEAANAAVLFELCLKDGLLLLSAALTWRLVSAERRSVSRLRSQRAEMDRLEERARRQASRVEQSERLAQVGLVSAGIVHDLKTPLMVIRGFAGICARERSLEAARKDLESIDRSARHCQAIVEGILRAAKNEPAPLVACELDEIVDEACGLCEADFARSSVKIHRRRLDRSLSVRASADELKRLLVNLLSNAAKAMPAGGLVTVETLARGGSEERRVEVAVEDTGPGLSEAALAALFKPFGTTRPREGGTGLGLYLSRDIAVRHGGSLVAANKPEGGARFVLTLPLAPAPHAGAPALSGTSGS